MIFNEQYVFSNLEIQISSTIFLKSKYPKALFVVDVLNITHETAKLAEKNTIFKIGS